MSYAFVASCILGMGHGYLCLLLIIESVPGGLQLSSASQLTL